MWAKWKNFRADEKRIKFKTPESELAQLKRLHAPAFGDEQTAILIIEQSIGNQWMGLFQLPNNQKTILKMEQVTTPQKHLSGGDNTSAIPLLLPG